MNHKNILSDFKQKVRFTKDVALSLYKNNEVPGNEEGFSNCYATSKLGSLTLWTPDSKIEKPLKTSIFAHNILIVNNTIFLIGGMTQFGLPVDSISLYNLSKQNQQMFINDGKELKLAVRRKFCSSFRWKDKVVVIGGKNQEAWSNFEIFSLVKPEKNRAIFRMTERKGFVSGSVFLNTMIVVSDDSELVSKIDLENSDEELFKFNGEIGFSFVACVGKTLVMMNCKNEGLILRDERIVRRFGCLGVSWVQCWGSWEGVIRLVDFFSGESRRIEYVNYIE